MTDVRLVATNPDDGVLVPVASNASGQLAVQSPKIEKIPNDLEVEGTVTATGFIGDGSSLTNLPSGPPPTPPFDGSLDGNLTVTGTGLFDGQITTGDGSGTTSGVNIGDDGFIAISHENRATQNIIFGYNSATSVEAFSITGSGEAKFTGDVVIGSRGKTWMIRESNGVAMLIEQTLTKEAPEKVRDLPYELDLIEAALSEIMDKLKMTPPAGWEVWDGSDNSQ